MSSDLETIYADVWARFCSTNAEVMRNFSNLPVNDGLLNEILEQMKRLILETWAENHLPTDLNQFTERDVLALSFQSEGIGVLYVRRAVRLN